MGLKLPLAFGHLGDRSMQKGAEAPGGCLELAQANTWGECTALLQLINAAFHQCRDKDVQVRTHLETERVSKIRPAVRRRYHASYRCHCNLLYVLVRLVYQTFSIAELSQRSDICSCMQVLWAQETSAHFEAHSNAGSCHLYFIGITEDRVVQCNQQMVLQTLKTSVAIIESHLRSGQSGCSRSALLTW